MVGFDLDATLFAGKVMAVARPWPVFRSFDEVSLDWIAVNVFQLLYILLMGQNVEVVVTALPEPRSIPFEEFGGFALEDAEHGG